MKSIKRFLALALALALIASMGLPVSAYWNPADGVLDFSDPQRHYLTYDLDGYSGFGALDFYQYVVTGTSGLTDVHQGRPLLSTTGSLSVTFDNANLQSERSILWMARAREFNIGDDPAEVTLHIVGENYFTKVGGGLDPIGIDANVNVSIVGNGTLTLNVTDPGEHQYFTLNRQFREGALTIAPTVTVICLNGLFEGASASPPPPPTDPLDSADTWAKDHIISALAKGFVPEDIQGDYTDTITRQEFARMAVEWVKYALGETDLDAIVAAHGLPERAGLTFGDTTDANILAAYRLGITAGAVAPTADVPGQFNPNGDFTRQEAATMIMNTCRAIGADTNNPPTADFADLSATVGWAQPGINFVRAHGIMSGDGTNFNPTISYTRQESIITFNNIEPDELP
ncbi:MAG: S-layer homology domain-containing protein [Oscillospiraceae bacterium]|nr:S-layer homology domain-containing protein [Oscillospiraceae bacterium]